MAVMSECLQKPGSFPARTAFFGFALVGLIILLGTSWFATSVNDDLVKYSLEGAEEQCTIHQPMFKEPAVEVIGRIEKHVNASDQVVKDYAYLIHQYLAPWQTVKENKTVGVIRQETLDHMGKLWLFMACCGHVKVVKGKLFYRHGGFYTVWYRELRFLQSLKMIQDAIDKYNLADLHAEFFLNTCDTPLGFYSDMWNARGGFPVFSTVVSSDSMDVVVPDPLDLSPSYTPELELQIPWERKVGKAVFRGATTNYDLRDGNWGSNPRVRLHRMTDAHPELLDARIHRWSHILPGEQAEMMADGVKLGSFMNFSTFNGFKYQVVVDGGGGSCRTCGVLRSNQLVIRQKSPAVQFFEPLLKDRIHILTVKRTMSDLPARVKWAQQHDEEVKEMVKRSNEFSDHACTWSGRMLYWAILLLKYQGTMRDPSLVLEPKIICKKSPLLEHLETSLSAIRCQDKDVFQKQQHPCLYYCTNGFMDPNKYVWLTADSLKDVTRIGPGQIELKKNQ